MKITQEILKEFLIYDSESGAFIWKNRERKWFVNDGLCAAWNKHHAATRAEVKQSKGNGYTRLKINIFGKCHMAHRLAWIYVTGNEPPSQIDHEDRNATNNSWKNLRDGSNSNQKNKSMQRNNTSGITGVSWSKTAGRWCARVWGVENGERIYKSLGLFSNKEAAGKAVEKYRESQGYMPGHGEEIAHYMEARA